MFVLGLHLFYSSNKKNLLLQKYLYEIIKKKMDKDRV